MSFSPDFGTISISAISKGFNMTDPTTSTAIEVSYFYGITIRMSPDAEHASFFAEYDSQIAEYDIETLRTIRGKLIPRAHTFVIEWASDHRDDLLDAWNNVQRGEQPKIEPLP